MLLSERRWALVVSVVSSGLVLSAMTAGHFFPAHGFPYRFQKLGFPRDEAYPWIRSDALRYRDLAEKGYDPIPFTKYWNVAYLPGYPWLVWAFGRISLLPTEWAMLIVSNALFVIAMMGWVEYLSDLEWTTPAIRRRFIVLYCLWPASLFFRAGYSESLFLLACVGFLTSLRRDKRWSVWAAAFWAGVAGTARVVGVALPAALLVHLWSRRCGLPWKYRTVCFLASWWGFLAVCTYQYYVTGDALAFLHVRQDWALRPVAPWWDRLASLLAFEPLWRPSWFLEGTAGGDWYASTCWFCKYVWLNPITSLAFPVLLLCADWRRLVRGDELLLAVLLWGIPYFGHGHENILLSHARYDLFVFPAYLLIVYALRRMPDWAWYAVMVLLLGTLVFFSYGFGTGCYVF